MKGLTVALGIALFALAATPTYAQQPPGPKDPHHPEPPAAAGGMMPMEMCRQMMGGQMMGGQMMGMPMAGEGQRMDPKAMAQMMEMRGEMMKTMGEIMLKHAKKMQGTPTGR